jgi:uncharacterized OB-fold protein
MNGYVKPLPKPSKVSAPFWAAARRHELVLQRCENCRAFIYYPRPRCPNCLGDRLDWQRVSGRGVVYSYTVVRRAMSRAFGDAPYVLAIVELEEGPRLTTNIVAEPNAVRIGMKVRARFDDVTPECTLVKFEPAEL